MAQLLSFKGDANLIDGAGNTLLMRAAEKGHDDTAKELITRSRARIDAQNGSGDTALMLAARNGKRALVKLLFDNNADRNLKNNSGKTALELAQEQGHKDTIKEFEKARSGQ